MVKVLLLEDNPSDANLIMRCLNKSELNVTYKTADKKEDFINLLNVFHPDIVLSDYYLPDIDGLTALNIIRNLDEDLPCIVLSGIIGEEKAVDIMKMGAHDFIIKDKLTRLVPAIKRGLQEFNIKKEYKKNIELLKQSEKNLKKSQELTQLGSFELTFEFNECIWSEELYRIFGYKPYSIQPSYEKIIEHIINEDKERIQQKISESIKKNKSYYITTRIRTNTGELKHLQSIGEVYSERDRQIKLIGSFQDITKQKKIENKLIIAKEQAEKSDRLKTRFLENISHEIRTPMNGIMGFIDLVVNKKNLSANKRNQYLNIIKNSSSQLLNIINNLIEISKIEADEFIKNVSEFEVNQFLDDIIKHYQAKAPYNNKLAVIKAIKENPSSQLYICQDKEKIKKVMNALIDNAYKFSYRKKGDIKIGCFLNPDQVTFYVSDNGIGIPEHAKESIFDCFRQEDESTTRKFGGAGIGLAICKGIVDYLKGKIWVESKEGKGSKFYFSIPLDDGENIKPFIYGQIKNTKQKWENKTIIVAEDDLSNYLLIEEMLADKSIKILRAENGIEAVEMVNKKQINLIIMDIKMPDMDGLQATQIIKKSHPTIPIIALTAFSTEDDKKQCLSVGCDGYLHKPVTYQKLMNQINNFI
jgi:PAS domain S-box-containing protein